MIKSHKVLLLLLLVGFALFGLCGCAEMLKERTITRHYLGKEDQIISNFIVPSGGVYVNEAIQFDGWFYDAEFTLPVDFFNFSGANYDLYGKFSFKFQDAKIEADNTIYNGHNSAYVTGLTEAKDVTYTYQWSTGNGEKSINLRDSGNYYLSVEVLAEYTQNNETILSETLSLTENIEINKRNINIKKQDEIMIGDEWVYKPKLTDDNFEFDGELALQTEDEGTYVWRGERHDEQLKWRVDPAIFLGEENVTHNFSFVYDISVSVKSKVFNFTAPSEYLFVYDGNPHTFPLVTGVTDSTVLYKIENGEFTEEIPTFTDAGTYKITYEASAEKYKTRNGEFTVICEKAGRKINTKSLVTEYTYNGEFQHIDLSSITYDGASESELKASCESCVTRGGELFFKDVPESGETVISLSVAESKNYLAAPQQEIKITINKADFSASSHDEEYIFDGSFHSDNIEVKTLSQSDEYHVSFIVNNGEETDELELRDFGDYSVHFIISDGEKNYNDFDGEFKISIAKADYTVLGAEDRRYVYNGAAQGEIIQVLGAEFDTEPQDEFIEISAYSFVNAGEYEVVFSVSGNPNYNALDGEYAVIIDRADYEISVDGEAARVTYNSKKREAKLITALDVFGNSVDVIYTSETSFTNAGEYTITYLVEGGENYNGVEGDFSFVIERVPLYVEEIEDVVYDGNEQSVKLKIRGYLNESDVKILLSEDGEEFFEQSNFENNFFAVNAGTYKIFYKLDEDFAGNRNYSLDGDFCEFTILPAPVTYAPLGHREVQLGTLDPFKALLSVPVKRDRAYVTLAWDVYFNGEIFKGEVTECGVYEVRYRLEFKDESLRNNYYIPEEYATCIVTIVP